MLDVIDNNPGPAPDVLSEKLSDWFSGYFATMMLACTASLDIKYG